MQALGRTALRRGWRRQDRIHDLPTAVLTPAVEVHHHLRRKLLPSDPPESRLVLWNRLLNTLESTPPTQTGSIWDLRLSESWWAHESCPTETVLDHLRDLEEDERDEYRDLLSRQRSSAALERNWRTSSRSTSQS